MAPSEIQDTKPTASETPSGAALRRTVVILCGLAILLGWLPRLHWGLWTDEAGTFWMACAGWRSAIDRCTQWAGQSVLYGVIESFFVTRGHWQEPLLRIPSVLAGLFAAWQFKRLADILIAPEDGWIAVVPFVCAADLMAFSTSARPYALALAATVASFRYLLEWQESNAKRTAVKFLAASVLIVHLQYLFGFVFLIQAAYLLMCRVFGRRVRLSLPVITAIVIPLSMTPVLRSLLVTARNKSDFSHAIPPTVLQLGQLCFPPALLLSAALGCVILMLSGRNLSWRLKPMRPEFAALIGTWLALPTIVFFLIARLTAISIFASRYLLFVLPAPVLLLTWLLSGLESSKARRLVLAAIFAGTVLHPAYLLQIFRESATSWREPLRMIAQETKSDAAPVFVESGVVESSGVNWQEHNPATSPLFAPLTAYPIPNPTIPLPYSFSANVKDFIRKKPFRDFKAGQRVFLLANSKSPLVPWMSSYLEQEGFRVERRDVNEFTVVEFRR